MMATGIIDSAASLAFAPCSPMMPERPRMPDPQPDCATFPKVDLQRCDRCKQAPTPESNPAVFSGACVRLKQLEEEHAWLKKLVSERTEVMTEIAAKVVVVPVWREQVAYATRRRLSQRRLCPLLGLALAMGSAQGRQRKMHRWWRAALARGTTLGCQRVRVSLDRESP